MGFLFMIFVSLMQFLLVSDLPNVWCFRVP
jgi:hypothetical protein